MTFQRDFGEAEYSDQLLRMTTRVQRKLEFQVRKCPRTRSRAKSTAVESDVGLENIPVSPRKRINNENVPVSVKPLVCSPSKKKKDTACSKASAYETPSRKSKSRFKTAKHDIENSKDAETFTESQLHSKEKQEVLPLSPRRDNPIVLSPRKNDCNIQRTPSKSNAFTEKLLSPTCLRLKALMSPSKENEQSRKLLQSPTKLSSADDLSKSPSCLKVKPLLLSPSKLNEQSLHSSRKEFQSPQKLLMSPSRSIFSSPSKLNEQSLHSPRREFQSPQKLLKSPSRSVHSPRRLLDFSPGKLRQSPRKGVLSPQRLGSPGKLRQSPRKAAVESMRGGYRHSLSLSLHTPDGAAYKKAKQTLHTAKPDRLICRENEVSVISQFLEGHLKKKSAGSLYISGAPGTGKTAVLSYLIDSLKKEHKCKTIFLNCMTLKDSVTVFNKLHQEITGKQITTSDPQKAMEKCLSASAMSIIIVLDEIDQLDSKKQEVLYTLFEWPQLPKSKLILVGIANALDLTDRVLPRLQARPKCKPQLLNFAPYSRNQIADIIKDRLQEAEVDGIVVEPSAIQFCARKVSAVAGDMRKALDVCRRAIEMVESEVRSQQVLKAKLSSPSKRDAQTTPKMKKITVIHISKILSEVYGSSTSASTSQQESFPMQQKLVLCTLLMMLKQGRIKEVLFGKLHEMYTKVCKQRQVAYVDQSEFLSLCNLLDARGILGMKKGKEARLTKITLKLDEKELEHTLQDKVLLSSILKDGVPK